MNKSLFNIKVNRAISLPNGQRSLSLSRRGFLRGSLAQYLSVAVGLPALDIMFNENGNAYAQDGGAPPKRFGTFVWGGGIHYNSWVPNATGFDWSLPEAFVDFADIKRYLTFATGLSHRGTSPGHIPARGIVLSGSHDLRRGIPGGGTYRGQNHPEPSVDWIAADAWKGQTQFDMLGVGICRKGPYRSNSSWRPGGANNHLEPSPQKLFDRIFSGGVPDRDTGSASLIENTTAAQISMLDAVREDADSLRQKLGADDRVKLDLYLESLREMEQNIQARGTPEDDPIITSCELPPRPSHNNFGDGGTREQKEEKARLMADLLTVAYSCDLTRVSCFEFSANQSEAVYWEVGENGTHHSDVTHGSSQGERNKKVIQFIMKNLAYFAKKLADTPEGAGNLLDQTLIYGTSEHANSGGHNYTNHPMLFVGGAGGGIRKGYHYAGSGNDGSRGLLTAVRAVGINRESVGVDSRKASSPITEILTG